jgi:hypothetical protein
VSNKNHLTGMQGVFLTAAELSRRGFIVSPTSRSAKGADLLVTDEKCRRAYSVQVKTNSTARRYWLLKKGALKEVSRTHIYVFVQLVGNGVQAEFFVVPSKVVKKRMFRGRFGKDMWYSMGYETAKEFHSWSAFKHS